jgi:hypothetical protein
VKLTKYSIFCALFWLVTSASAQQTPVGNSLPAKEQGGIKYSLQLSPYTHHWSARDPEDRDVFLVGMEREHPSGKIDGFAFFSNTFGQESFYFFPWGGVYKQFYGIPKLSFKWTAGVIYGYKPPFDKKVPLNYKGFSPGIIPALTYDFSPTWSGQVNLLGTQGVMFQINVPLN